LRGRIGIRTSRASRTGIRPDFQEVKIADELVGSGRGYRGGGGRNGGGGVACHS
jgi:hypothetical protein